jgi:hypothetical protein
MKKEEERKRKEEEEARKQEELFQKIKKSEISDKVIRIHLSIRGKMLYYNCCY